MIFLDGPLTLAQVITLEEKTIYFREVDQFTVYYVKEDGCLYKVGFKEKEILMIKMYDPSGSRMATFEKERIVNTYFAEIRMEAVL